MKKNYLYILFLLLISIVFIPDAYALDINFDITSSNCNSNQFNFYCEIKNETDFADIYIPNKQAFGSYIADLTAIGDVYDAYFVYIAKDSTYVEPSNTKYVVYLYAVNSTYPEIVLNTLTNNIYSSIDLPHYFVGGAVLYTMFFDPTFSLISYETTNLQEYSGYYSLLTNDMGNTDITSFYTSFLYSDFKIITARDIRVKFVNTDSGEIFLNDNFGFIQNTWFSIFGDSTKYLDSTTNLFGLGYLDNHYLATSSGGLLTLNTILTGVNVEIPVPSNYSSSDFSNTDKKYLVPNSNSCSSKDTILFFTSSLPSTSYTTYLFGIDQNDTINYDYHYLITSSFTNAFTIYSRNLNKEKINDIPFTYNNFIILIEGGDDFGSKTMYFNPDCYSLKDFNTTFSFVNPNTSNTITFDTTDQAVSYNEHKYVPRDGDYEYNIANDITLDQGINSVQTFLASVSGVGTLFTTFFLTMPPFIQSIGIFSLTLGVILILLKIILNR